MSMPHPNTDPFAPVTRVELHAELADIREAFARIGERLEDVDGFVRANAQHLATKEYVLKLNVVLKSVLGITGVLVALLSIAVGIILRFG